jgi:hypothetical protein
VYCEERFLHEILHFIGQAQQAFAQKRPQVLAQFFEKRLITSAVAGQSGEQKLAQTIFTRTPRVLSLYSLHRGLWLPASEKNLSSVRKKFLAEGVTGGRPPTNYLAQASKTPSAQEPAALAASRRNIRLIRKQWT